MKGGGSPETARTVPSPHDETPAASHTPGPWRWEIYDHSMASLGSGDNIGLGDPLVLTVAPCPACADRADPKVWEWGRCQTPREADARLIAAAPDLLEACKEALAEFIDNGMHGLPTPELLRKAIAKAEAR